ncbi:MAG: hypothetical protein K2O18_06025 [Oscillospiraceae bacterium]|nr:hypothetical protein [Oscillospiraceae bacterium]
MTITSRNHSPYLSCEAFYRVDASRNRQTGGSGLGLYLAKMIVEKYNGTICISNTGFGVTAVIQLPAVH